MLASWDNFQRVHHIAFLLETLSIFKKIYNYSYLVGRFLSLCYHEFSVDVTSPCETYRKQHFPQIRSRFDESSRSEPSLDCARLQINVFSNLKRHEYCWSHCSIKYPWLNHKENVQIVISIVRRKGRFGIHQIARKSFNIILSLFYDNSFVVKHPWNRRFFVIVLVPNSSP